MVPVPTVVGRDTKRDSAQSYEATPTTLGLPTPEPKITVLESVAHQLSRLTEAGFLPSVLGQLKLSRTKSTNQTYDSKWKLFEAYATEQGYDAFKATAAQVADFLLHIFKTRNLRHSTVSAYRTAIGQVLWLSNDINISNNKVISLMLKSFERQTP